MSRRRFKCEVSRTLSARVEETLRTNRMADVTLVTDNGAERIMAHQVSEQNSFVAIRINVDLLR